MVKIGIICEYNPFHNGHVYHLKKIKELYPDSLIILVLNGYFLERGEISIQTKKSKTQLALEANVDIVIELPFIYGTQSADAFADASLKILNNLGVEKLIFGSECNDINIIKNIALKEQEKDYDDEVKKLLDEGLNYPTALAKSLHTDFSFTPNDLLGISYCKSIIKNNYNIDAITIKRTSDYHNTTSSEPIISASNIRSKLQNLEPIAKYLPQASLNLIEPYNEEFFFQLLKSKIITDNHLEEYLDVDEGIENRLKEKIVTATSLENYIRSIKTKRYTHNKIRRMLIHILMGFKKSDSTYEMDYIKILGFNKLGQEYLKSIKNDVNISFTINKESLIYQYEIKASLIYDLIMNTNTYEFEHKKKPIIFE